MWKKIFVKITTFLCCLFSLGIVTNFVKPNNIVKLVDNNAKKLQHWYYDNNIIDEEKYSNNFYLNNSVDTGVAPADCFIDGENVSGNIGYSINDQNELTIIKNGTTIVYATNPNFLSSITKIPDKSGPYTLVGFADFTSSRGTAFCFEGKLTIPSTVTSIGNFVFQSLTGIYPNLISDVILPNTLETIGDGVFRNCYELINIHLSDSLKELSNSLFLGCFSLKEINIKNIEIIQANVFNGCTSLTNIEFEHVTSIGIQAFCNCSGLTSIDLSKCSTLETIGAAAFKTCTNLKKVILPTNIKDIPSSCFSDCSNLQSINLDNILTLGYEAFNACTSLIKIVLNNNVADIPYGCFLGCSNLSSINLDNIVTLGDEAFYACTSLIKIVLNNNVADIPDSCFFHCSNLTLINLGNVTQIGQYAFSGCNIKEISLSNDIISIGEGAFNGCPIKQVNFEGNDIYKWANNVGQGHLLYTSDEWDYQTPPIGCLGYGDINMSNFKGTIITAALFAECAGITSINLSQCTSLTSIDINAFTDCSGLTIISLPISLALINSFAFSNCIELTSIDLSQCTSLTTIEQSAFENCTKLTFISLPSSLETIGESAFAECPIKQVNFEGNDTYKWVNNVGQGHLLFTSDEWDYQTSPIGCLAYGDIDMSNFTGTTIADDLFADCAGIISITLPNYIRYIGINSFVNCENLKSVNLNNIYEIISSTLPTNLGAFTNCSRLESINLNKLNVIDDNIFSFCTSLKNIIFSKFLFRISNLAFSGCKSINSITFNWIDQEISYCVNLGKIDSEWLLNAVGSDKMSNVTVHVPVKQKVEYEKYAQQLGIQGCNIVEGSNPIDNDLPLILGLSLGLGIPTIVGIITGTTISIKNHKIKKSS